MAREYHHLYNTASWQRARTRQLQAHPLCNMHKELGQIKVANVVDHIKPHRGDMQLFLEASNLQSLCKQCHDSHKQAQEHSPGGLLRGAGHTGAPLDRAHHWHQTPATPGAGQISESPAGKTGPYCVVAKCQLGRGGLSG